MHNLLLLTTYCIDLVFEFFCRIELDVSASTSHSANTSQSGSTSQSASTSHSAKKSNSLFDADLLYASWLFEEVNPSVISSASESEGEEITDNLTSPCGTKLDHSVILGQLASSINLEKICKFNISRSNVWEGAVRGLSRKSFCPENKISVKFCDDLGTAEGAVDQGGPKREFFTLALESIMNSQIFCGSESNKFLSCNASCRTNEYYFFAGEIIAMSLVHGGPGFRCLAPAVFDSIISDTRSVSVDVNDVYDFQLKTSLVKMTNCKSLDEGKSLVNDPAIETILDLAGTLKPVNSVQDVIRMAYETALLPMNETILKP